MANWEKLEFASGPDLRSGVGMVGSNEYEDVALVVALLNRIPASQGGPDAPLGTPQKGDPLLKFAPDSRLIAAIEKFQKTQFGAVVAGGYVGPSSATLLRMMALATPGDGAILAIKGSLRAKVLEVADAEVGIVGDAPGARERRRWERLKTYFDESLKTPIAWQVKPNPGLPMKYTDKAGTTHQLGQMLDGVRLANRRVPQSNKPEVKDGKEFWRGISWCGIFANWVWGGAGLGTKWQLGVGPSGGTARIEPSANFSALMPGDMVVKKGGEVHHALVSRVRPGGKEFETIDGNTAEAGVDQTVARHMIRLEEVRYFYSMDSVAMSGLVYPAQIGRK